MNIQRFLAPTSREALAKARRTFGDGTLILSNRPTAEGVEVVATAEDTLESLDQQGATFTQIRRSEQDLRRPAPSSVAVDSNVEEDIAQLSMSTLSFQDYVRERMLRRRQESSPDTAKATQLQDRRPELHAMPKNVQGAISPSQKPVSRKNAIATPVTSSTAAPPLAFMQELQSMRALIEERFDTMAWLGQARQHPITSNMMLKFVRSGFSTSLARTVLEKMPDTLNAADSMQWILDVLERNLKTDERSAAIHDQGGTFALVGATGVGKTTTTAKLAGFCAQTHGAASVGLITLDTHRVGGHDQLRSYGRMLGVVAHLAHDRAALQDLLGLLSNKKMILIDTVGLAPHDPRRRDMMNVLDLPGIKRLLVLNAGSHGDTLDDVVSSFKENGPQQAVLTKLDEAVRLGPVLDTAIRHHLVLRGVTTGQKVPEDFERASSAKLIRAALRAPARSAFDPKAEDLGYFFSGNPGKTSDWEEAHV